MPTLMLAHGGTVGLIFEIGFLAVPVLVFTLMALLARRREDGADGGEAGGGGEVES
ncbi:MAG: hypothetical protein ACRDZW_02865 [Acidimicrobiales bacterium]